MMPLSITTQKQAVKVVVKVENMVSYGYII